MFQGDAYGGLRGYWGKQVSKVVLRAANELPWPIGYQIGATLDVMLSFKKGGFRGHLKEGKEGQGAKQGSNIVFRGANELA